MVDERTTFQSALEDFHRARSKAALQHFWASITGKSLDLLPFDEISEKLHASAKTEKGLQVIPLESIIGSVGRYYDFDRNFLPLRDSDVTRWASVKTAMVKPGGIGVPPISVYKVGEVYFVLDGNHRVSIAKQMGMDEIEAYVTEIKTRVPITPDVSPEELILKQEYVNFLEKTRLDYILPDHNFTLTFPGLYELLIEHIRVHRHYMGIEQEREIPYEEAVQHWFEHIYSPVIEIINDSGLMVEFKEKTVTDLYLWILDHQSILERELGIQIRAELAADHMAFQEGKSFQNINKRGEQYIEELIDTNLEAYESDNSLLPIPKHNYLFNHILVALNGLESGWDALEQAIRINRNKEGEIRGLHVVDGESIDSKFSEELTNQFNNRIHNSGQYGKLLIAEGEITKLVHDYSLLNDLLVLKLIYAPSDNIFDRLSSGFSALLRKSKRPILVVREEVTDLDKILLAYDGSPKSKEALFMSAYFAARYGSTLRIISIDDGSADIELQVSYAKSYLNKMKINYQYLFEKGDVTRLVIRAVETLHANFLLLGGYSSTSLFGVVFGSSVDSILRNLKIPALICQ